MPPWNAPRAKVQLRLSIQRLRTTQQKKEAQAKATRRDIATLIERGKLDTARIKVESLINEDIHVELLELLELYCELLLARFGLLEQSTREPDLGIKESVCSIIHAAPRTELKELHILREILMHKYGREFSVATMENQNNCVSDRVIRKLIVATPSSDLVEAYLSEIAKAYGVDWTSDKNIRDDKQEGEIKESEIVSETEKNGRTIGPDSEVTRSPKINEDQQKKKEEISKPQSTELKNEKGPSPAPIEDDFEALTKRFAALKKR